MWIQSGNPRSLTVSAVVLTSAWLLCSPATYAADRGFWISGIEAVQAVQTPWDGIPLIAGKPTFVRVYLRSNERGHGPWKNIKAELSVTGHNGAIRARGPISRPTITVSPKGSNRTRWDDSFTFLLDDDETLPNSTIAVQAHVYSAIGETDGNPPAEHNSVAVYNFSPALNLTLYGFVWQATCNLRSDPPSPAPFCPSDTPSNAASVWSDFDPQLPYLNATFPVSLITIRPIDGYGTTTQKLLDLQAARAFADSLLANLPPDSLINFVTPWDTGGLHGAAAGHRSEEQRQVTGHRAGVVAAQEIAHSLKLPCHTFDPQCKNPPYQPIPYPRANHRIDAADIGIYPTYPVRLLSVRGVRVLRVLPGAVWAPSSGVTNYLGADDQHWVNDIMSYQVPPWTWVSSFTYCGLLQGVLDILHAHSTPSWSADCTPAITVSDRTWQHTPSPFETSPGKHLHVSGVVRGNNTGAFDFFDEVERAVTLLISPGPYRIEFWDGQEQVVKGAAFDTGSRHPNQAQGDQRFSLLIPYDEELAERTKTVVLRRGATILARRDMHATTPTVSLRESFGAGDIAQGTRTIQWDSADPGGSLLMHTVEYSKDGGKSWMPVAVRVQQNQVRVDFDQVAGSEEALLRVRASNGVRTAQATSNNRFRVRRKPPIVTMQSPVPNARIVRTVPLIAIGSATTLEEGPLADPQAYTWTSSRDGVLGHGRWIALNRLSVGDHDLMLTVTGNQGATASVSRTLTVQER